MCVGAAAVSVEWSQSRLDFGNAQRLDCLPTIAPDYSGITIPANIAPLNFRVREPGDRFVVQLTSTAAEPIKVVSSSPQIVIPAEPWRQLLGESRGEQLQITLFVERNGRWYEYQPIHSQIAEEDIDAYIAYRLIAPGHESWREVSVHQRELATYRESTLLDGSDFDGGCVNCHSFAANDPRRMLIGMRSGEHGDATILVNNGDVKKIGTRFGYTAWHPSGRLAVYSLNQTWQFFHTAGNEVRDVIDLDSALAYYLVGDEQVSKVPGAADKQRLESYPAWSPDGFWLYYCSAPLLWSADTAIPPERYAEVRYDLMRIRYDVATGTWGDPETVLAAEETGQSILQPRVSPDGRYLLFCMCRYGCFPVYQPTSDLYMMTVATGDYRRLEINSEFSESWHSWSSNSRWIAFSSKRLGGLFTRCFLSFVDEKGMLSKPFLLPQKDPEFYDSFLKTVSVPELITGPVPVTAGTLARAARSNGPVVVDGFTGASPRRNAAAPSSPSRE